MLEFLTLTKLTGDFRVGVALRDALLDEALDVEADDEVEPKFDLIFYSFILGNVIQKSKICVYGVIRL
jgi:hypothetical protein